MESAKRTRTVTRPTRRISPEPVATLSANDVVWVEHLLFSRLLAERGLGSSRVRATMRLDFPVDRDSMPAQSASSYRATNHR